MDDGFCNGECVMFPHKWSDSGARCVRCGLVGTGDRCGDGNCDSHPRDVRIVKERSAFFGMVGRAHIPDEPDPDGQVAVMFNPFDAPDWFDRQDVEVISG